MKNKWIILSIITLASFMTPLDASITNVAMPAIASSFQTSFSTLAMVPLAYLLSLAVFMIPFGKLADIHGRKNFFIFGLIIFTIASIFSGFAQNIYHLLIARFIQGIGASLISATGTAIVTETFPQNERGKALGINVASVYLGLTLGPLIGGLIVQTLNWRYIFFINIPIGIVASILAFKYFENVKEGLQKARFNITAAISLAVFIFSILSMHIFEKLQYYLIILLAIVSLGIFIATEMKSQNPLIGIKHLQRNRVFIFANITALLNYVGLFAVSFMMSFYLISVKGLSPLHAGLILGITPVSQAILSPIAGRQSDRIGSRKLCSIGMAMLCVGILALSFITIETSLIFISGVMILIGIGMGLFSSPNTSSVMGSVEKARLGIASSFLGTIRFIGQSLSIIIMTVIISIIASPGLMKDLISGTGTQIANAKAEFILGVHYTFIIFAVIAFIGIFTSLARSGGRISGNKAQ